MFEGTDLVINTGVIYAVPQTFLTNPSKLTDAKPPM
jgi:hypothetical protein